MSHFFKVVLFTLVQAACSTGVAALIGIPAAFFCSRRKFFGRKLLLSFSIIPVCIPALIVALGYVTFLGINGGLNQFLMFVFNLEEPPVKILYSFLGLILAQGFYNFPLVMKNVADVWERIPSEPAESARLLGAGEFRIFKTVTFYQLIPSILSSTLLVFIYCFLSFILVLLFGGIGNSTLEVEIYKASRATLDFKNAAFLGLAETIILCLITIFYSIIEQKNSHSKGINSQVIFKRKSLSLREIVPFLIILLLITLFFIAPLAGIGINAFTTAKKGSGFTFSTFEKVFKMKTFIPSVITTLKIALCTGFFCMILGFLYSVLLRFVEKKSGKKLNLLLKVIPMLPMCVSSVVVGVLIIMMVKRGNGIILVTAQTLLFWPLAFRVIYPQLSKISDSTIDSAVMISKNKFDTIRRVLLPVSKKSLISAFGFCFAVSAGDTTLPLVMAIPKFDTLSLFTYRLAGAYRFNEACAAGLLLGILCIFVYLLSNRLVKSK